MSGERWYVYGIVESSRNPAVLEDGLRLVAEDGIAAVARLVPADDFDDDRVRERLQDTEWVTALAVEHSGVLDRLREQATVLPMRICTVYRSEERLREMLSAESAGLSSVLERLKGRSEWGVKVSSVGPPSLAGQHAPDRARDGAGAAYLLARRRERDQIADADRLIDEACDEVHELLSAAAAVGRANPPQRQELLNGVYLVDDRVADEFRHKVGELSERHRSLGLELEVSGPWPAYNFVPDREEAGR